jgi:photosystem II stability/assembly factor-like uncharacterized protein
MKMLASNRCSRFTSLRTLALFAIALLAWPSLSALHAQTTPFQHRWAGFVFDSFTFDGGEAWTVEDGGRIRHRSASNPAWSFQIVPSVVTGALRRIHFVPGGSPGPTGWAVGDDGWIIKTTDGGANWAIAPFDTANGITQVPAVLPLQYREEFNPDKEQLWDVFFLDTSRGWLCGLHGIWQTTDGGTHWTACTVKMQDHHHIFGPLPTDMDFPLLKKIEFYALDVIERSVPGGEPPFERVGMASGEPGLVFKTTDGTNWEVVLDIRCMCPPGCSQCYDCTTLPAVTGVLGGPTDGTTSLQCEVGICNGASDPFEMWDVQMSRDPNNKLAVAVGGSGHDCGMTFTSTDDGVHWKKESHECQAVGLPGGKDCEELTDTQWLYHDIPGISTHTFRLQHFATLYNASVLSGTNTALASGYSGETVVRNPATGVWEDHSYATGRIDEVPTAVTLPMTGITATDTGSKAIMVGYGGTIRETINGGVDWFDSPLNVPVPTWEHSAPWRIHALRFPPPAADKGYQAGQLGRIGTTVGNAGVGWGHDSFQGGHPPDRHSNTASTLFSIVFSSSSNLRGVAVGGLLAQPSTGAPMILYTTNPPLNGWQSPISVTKINGGTYEPLWDVCYAGVTTGGLAIYWAAGSGGFMLYSNDNGLNWSQFNPPQYTKQKLGIDLFGVAFKDPSTGIFVGHGADPTGTPARPLAYGFINNGTTITWTDISPSLTGTIDAELRDVVIAGNTAYAVGEKTIPALPSPIRVGVVVSSSWSSSTGFSTFAPLIDSPQHGFPMSTTNDPHNDLESTSVLLSAEIEAGTTNLWIGGQCGRVWRRSTTTGWTEFPNSQTSTHIEGISFPVAGTGFFGGYRKEEIGHCLVRYHLP